MKFIKYFLIVVLTLFFAIGLYFLTVILCFSMLEDSDEVKIKETKEAFELIQFDKRVVDNLGTIDKLTTFLKENYEEILDYYNLTLKEKNKFYRRQGVHIHIKNIGHVLPDKIGCPIDSLLKSISNSPIGSIGIYNDKSISYRIYSANRPTASWNYRIYQDLNHGIIMPTNYSLTKTSSYISKDTIIRDYQYCIKLEPYIGW